MRIDPYILKCLTMQREIFQDKIIDEILKRYRVIWALGHASSIMGWDSETYMPKKGFRDRAVASSELSTLSKKLLTDPEMVKLVEKALDKYDELNDFEKGVVRVLERSIRIYTKLPDELVREIAETREEARVHWGEAKLKDDFNIFKPYLKKTIELAKQVAYYLGDGGNPYDALLDLFEEGLTYRDASRYLWEVTSELKKIFDDVISSERFPQKHPLEEKRYRREDMERVNKIVLDIIGYPWDRARLDVSMHPFTMSAGLDDVRITTRYEEYDFRRTLYSVLHEFGHALYDLQVDDRFRYTPIEGGASLGIHESQSRFWENIVGRDIEFVRILKPILDENIKFTASYDVEELYRYFNIVRPSLIRVDADELTYDFHILIRMEIENALINDELEVEEAPEKWNEMMDKYLGVKPLKDSEGILQDIHWSIGMIGYFPTYSLGNILASQILEAFRRKFGEDVSSYIEKKEFDVIREFLREHIHRYGGMYKPMELIKLATGEGLNTRYYIDHLREKFLLR